MSPAYFMLSPSSSSLFCDTCLAQGLLIMKPVTKTLGGQDERGVVHSEMIGEGNFFFISGRFTDIQNQRKLYAAFSPISIWRLEYYTSRHMDLMNFLSTNQIG